MKTLNNILLRRVRRFALSATVPALAMVAALCNPLFGQNGPQTIGLPDDWSHKRVIFSNPGSVTQAVQKGSPATWQKNTNEPPFHLHQLKRQAAEHPPATAALVRTS